jgi:adenosylcobinamide-GDP ribazoletransferase
MNAAEMLRERLAELAAAFALLTRLPVHRLALPRVTVPSEAVWAYPVVGAAVGAIGGAVYWITHSLSCPPALAAICALVAMILGTGALHEDGLADFADALGGRTREARLAIMKDSRLGTYGALALGLMLALKIAALASLPLPIAVAALIAAHGVGRLGAVALMAALPYAGNPEATKITYTTERLHVSEMTLASAFVLIAIAPLLVLAPSPTILGLLLAIAVTIGLACLARALLGGYTGDVLGATEQLCATALLLGCAAMI